MNISEFKTIAELIQSIMVTLAIITGGIWALYRFRLLREYEGNIELEITTTCSPCENTNAVVFIDTTIKNTGTRTVTAKPRQYLNGKILPVYQNSVETFYNSFTLQIKCLNTHIKDSTAYDWYNSSHFKNIHNLPDEINLLTETDVRPKIGDFWLNAGDTCHFGTVVTLLQGHYLAKVSFFGTQGAPDYCSHIFYFHIEQSSASNPKK